MTDNNGNNDMKIINKLFDYHDKLRRPEMPQFYSTSEKNNKRQVYANDNTLRVYVNSNFVIKLCNSF